MLHSRDKVVLFISICILCNFQSCGISEDSEIQVSISPEEATIASGGIYTQEQFVVKVSSSDTPLSGLEVYFSTSIGGFEKGCNVPIMTDENGEAVNKYIPPGVLDDCIDWANNDSVEVMMQFMIRMNDGVSLTYEKVFNLSLLQLTSWQNPEQHQENRILSKCADFYYPLWVGFVTDGGFNGVDGIPMYSELLGEDSEKCILESTYQKSVDGMFVIHMFCSVEEPLVVVKNTVVLIGMDDCSQFSSHSYTILF